LWYFRADNDVKAQLTVACQENHLHIMKVLVYLFALLICQPIWTQTNFGLELLGHWDDASLPINPAGTPSLNLKYNSCWGLTVKNREYAVVGGSEHVLFFDVTEPATPKLARKFHGRAKVIPREFKSYKNRVYAVADGQNDGLMIFDLSNAEDTIVLTYWDTTFFKKIHTIALDTSSGWIYLNGGDAGDGIMVLDASQNPDAPTFLAHPILPGGRVHDCYVRNDTVYASSGYEGYYIFDFKDPQNPKLLAQNGTGGYNHNSWLTIDGKYAYYAEEIPVGQPIHIVDLQNLALGEIEIVGSFLNNLLEPDSSIKKAIPHNLYIKGDLLFDSQYEDGLLVYDISERLNPVLIAHYDTHPQNTKYNGYYGNWGNYPWLPSGTIIASDMQNGLFLFRLATSETKEAEYLPVNLFPNPAQHTFFLQSINSNWLQWAMYDLSGKLVKNGEIFAENGGSVALSGVLPGFYIVKVEDEHGRFATRKIMVK
jgi:choice-of-anchor B domain-containing protein